MGPYLPKPITTKPQDFGQTEFLRFWVTQMQGWRQQMEDFTIYEPQFLEKASLFGVMDGHNGPFISQFVQKNFAYHLRKHKMILTNPSQALFDTIQKMDDLLIQSKAIQQNKNSQQTCGSTLLVVLFINQKLYIGNLGDSLAYLRPKKGEYHRINKPHSSPDRIAGIYNISRTIGDLMYKQTQQLENVPDVYEVPYKPGELIFLGTDGLWEGKKGFQGVQKVFDNDFVSWGLKSQQAMDQNLAKRRSDARGRDNMALIVIEFKQQIAIQESINIQERSQEGSIEMKPDSDKDIEMKPDSVRDIEMIPDEVEGEKKSNTIEQMNEMRSGSLDLDEMQEE